MRNANCRGKSNAERKRPVSDSERVIAYAEQGLSGKAIAVKTAIPYTSVLTMIKRARAAGLLAGPIPEDSFDAAVLREMEVRCGKCHLGGHTIEQCDLRIRGRDLPSARMFSLQYD